MHPQVHSRIIYNSQAIKQPKLNRWMNRKRRYSAQWNISHKKKEVLPFVTTLMNPENSMLSEIS